MSKESPKLYCPQRLSRFNDALLIRSVDFPIYYLECLSERHFIIAGGGGSSKTGVHNQINVLELVPTDSSCATELIMKFHTPEEIPDAIMSGSLMRDLPIVNTSFVASGSSPTIYNLSFNSSTKSFTLTDYELLNNRSPDVEIKSVKCAPERVIGGGIDGDLIIWDIADRHHKRIVKRFKAHMKAIDELDINLKENQLVTLSRDEAKCAIWDLSSFKLIKEFRKNDICSQEPNTTKYCYRSCKYAYDHSAQHTNTTSNDSFLFVVCNPIASKKAPSKLFKWPTNDYKKLTSVNIKSDGIMAMTVSLGGRYVAVGSRSGSVSIFDTKNLKQVYRIEGAHHNAVTSLEFLTPNSESLYLTNSKTCPLISVSIDRRIVLHRPKKSSLLSHMFILFLMVLFIYIIFLVLYENYLS